MKGKLFPRPLVWLSSALVVGVSLSLALPSGAWCSRLAGLCEPYDLTAGRGSALNPRGAEALSPSVSAVFAQAVLDKDGPASRSITGRTQSEDRAARIPPGLAFLMSAAVPGAGQLAEGRNRAFVYLGLEALAWISHFAYLDSGEKKEGEYEAYARRHWDLEAWGDRADTCQGALPAGVDFEQMKQTLLDHLDAGELQHYYEDIGKLEAYRAGWDDFACESPEVISPNRHTYRSMRADSNDYLERARFAATMAFLNRIVSAVDAFRTAKGARLSLSQSTSVEVQVAGSFENPRANLRIRRRW